MAKKLSSIILDRKVRMDFPSVDTAPVLASYDPNELSELAPYSLDELLTAFTQPGAKRSFSMTMLDRVIRFAFTMEAFYVRQITTRVIDPEDIAMTIRTSNDVTVECLLTNKIRQTDALTIRNMDVNKMGGLDASN